jgi:hypothetical protein
MSIRLVALALCLAGIAPAHAASSGRSTTAGRSTAARPAPRASQNGRTVVRPPAPARPIQQSARVRATSRAVKVALQRLIDQRNANSLRPQQGPKVTEIRITASHQGPFGSIVVYFDAKVGRDWFAGGSVSLRQTGAVIEAISAPKFDNPFTDRNVAYGDNTLESVGG